MVTISAWSEIQPLLVTIPLVNHYTVPYGIIYPLNPSQQIQTFINSLQGLDFGPLKRELVKA